MAASGSARMKQAKRISRSRTRCIANIGPAQAGLCKMTSAQWAEVANWCMAQSKIMSSGRQQSCVYIWEVNNRVYVGKADQVQSSGRAQTDKKFPTRGCTCRHWHHITDCCRGKNPLRKASHFDEKAQASATMFILTTGEKDVILWREEMVIRQLRPNANTILTQHATLFAVRTIGKGSRRRPRDRGKGKWQCFEAVMDTATELSIRLLKCVTKRCTASKEMVQYATTHTPDQTYRAIQRVRKFWNLPHGPLQFDTLLKAAQIGTKTIQFDAMVMGWCTSRCRRRAQAGRSWHCTGWTRSSPSSKKRRFQMQRSRFHTTSTHKRGGAKWRKLPSPCRTQWNLSVCTFC